MNYNSIRMEYQKINLLENTPNQPSKFRAKNQVEINDESRGLLWMLRSSLCDYSDAYTLVSATLTVPNTAAAGAAANKKNKNIKNIIKNCAPFINCICKVIHK